jgi:hypothetical protein
MMDDDECEPVGRMMAGETEVLGDNCHSATLYTINSTQPDLGSNPGHWNGKPVFNRLSYGTAMQGWLYFTLFNLPMYLN